MNQHDWEWLADLVAQDPRFPAFLSFFLLISGFCNFDLDFGASWHQLGTGCVYAISLPFSNFRTPLLVVSIAKVSERNSASPRAFLCASLKTQGELSRGATRKTPLGRIVERKTKPLSFGKGSYARLQSCCTQLALASTSQVSPRPNVHW
jgi:hypothetical protein